MAIEAGQPAPDFTLFTSEKEPWTLSEHRGEAVVLLFVPGAFTSVCTDQLVAVSNDLDAYTAARAVVVGISTDSPFVLKEFGSVNQIRFRLLSDHSADVADKFGAKYDNDFTDMNLDRVAKRAAFVIDGGGTVRYAEVLDNAGQMPDFDAIKETLRQLG
jgi:glutaredoxin-dependent peroxiredoxin